MTLPTKPHHVTPLVYRRRDILKLFKISGTTLVRWMETGKFPKPLKTPTSASLWSIQEVDNWFKKSSSN